MTIRQLAAIARRVRYKPGWIIRAFSVNGEVAIEVRGRVPNAYRSGPQTVETFRTDYLSRAEVRALNERSALRAAKRAVDAAERHEVGEFFRYRGTRPFDPHRR